MTTPLQFDNAGVPNAVSVAWNWTTITPGFPATYNGVTNTSGLTPGTVIDANWHAYKYENLVYVMDQGGVVPSGSPTDLFDGIVGVINSQLGAIPSAEGVAFISNQFELSLGTTQLAEATASTIDIDKDRIAIAEVEGPMDSDGSTRVVQQMSIRAMLDAAKLAGYDFGAGTVSTVPPPSFALGSSITVNVSNGDTLTGHSPVATNDDGSGSVLTLAGADAANLTINSTGELQLNSPADRTTQASYSVAVVATDTANNVSSSQLVTINVDLVFL